MKISVKFVAIPHFVLVIMISLSNASISPNTSFCSGIADIGSIFAISNQDPAEYSPWLLHCERNRTVVYCDSCYDYSSGKPYSNKYIVQSVDYSTNLTLRLVDSNIRKNICSSMPDSLTPDMFYEGNKWIRSTETEYSEYLVSILSRYVIFVSCVAAVNSPIYIDTSPCINGSAPRNYSYVIVGDLRFSELKDSCRVDSMALISTRRNKFSSFRQVHDELSYGFEISFSKIPDQVYPPDLMTVNYDLHDNENPSRLRVPFADIAVGLASLAPKLVMYIEIPRMVCVVIVIAILAHKWYTRHLSMHDGIEEFLRSNNNLMPIRYSYWEIRIMTRVFKDKLGEGGFGSVYKGTLSNGRLVAVKILGKSKANGQDFINEVATIGRIHHANVVHLIGFCATGSKRALVYDFMPNGSLDKYIFRKEGATSTHHALSYKEIFNVSLGVARNIFRKEGATSTYKEIFNVSLAVARDIFRKEGATSTHHALSYKEIFNVSLGVARGINYLHQGCDMQILHFDIKPHNILLDENFAPRVSDFGLARLYPLDNSILSITAARGTIGYMAPELFYKNIGGVSHKSDVYSFGMLLMEMANKRKNVNATATKSSQIYFPTWIFEQFSQGNDMELEEETTEEDSEMVKKMIIVALWCIQLKPCDRPSMSKVTEMLEGDLESLEMPPKPYFFPQANDRDQDLNHGFEEATESSCSSTPTEEDSTEISLISTT